MKRNVMLLLLLTATISTSVSAQESGPFFKDALQEKRDRFYNNLVARSIKSNLSLPLNEANEDAWINAFNTLLLIKYQDSAVRQKLDLAARTITARSDELKKSFLSLVNSDYPAQYDNAALKIFRENDNDAKLLAMAVNYLLPSSSVESRLTMLRQVADRLIKEPGNIVLQQLALQIAGAGKVLPVADLTPFFAADYLAGNVLVISIQRPDRNYPGIAVVRTADGHFIKNADSSYFFVEQMARSQSNMPSYISLGNTPQGIFRMDGFDTSKSFFIGPTTNIQLTLPFEYKASHFFRDTTMADSAWVLAAYKNLLPLSLRDFPQFYGTFYAGNAGRNEIICHGSTINPEWYRAAPYYPFTPTEGCLVTKEEWNEKTGYLRNSDQQLLTDAVRKAGGATGYLILAETADKKTPVSLSEIQTYLPK